MNAEFFLKSLVIAVVTVVLLYALSLFDLYTQIGRYKNYWDDNNKREPTKGELLYVALGDSTAQAIGASKPEKGYVGLISVKLAERSGKPVRTINLGVTGAKVQDIINTQIPKLNELKIKKDTVITIEAGANDIINFDATKFEKSIDQLMGEIPPQTLMTDIPYFGSTRYKSSEPNVRVANQIMYRLAKKHGFELVPLHDRIEQNSGLRTLAVDIFHPSNIAYRENWAPVFLERLK